ncbi:hypothetical protein H5410_053134 [Solanum commersonii]|uniref:Uncharacterized protein n=1 Tax=Solanum commersonii TaxID=4109 RepID=A0A9J5X305_SOLCO|nr:hypothetical protein H5410_053134 [Solanum commersonii]
MESEDQVCRVQPGSPGFKYMYQTVQINNKMVLFLRVIKRISAAVIKFNNAKHSLLAIVSPPPRDRGLRDHLSHLTKSLNNSRTKKVFLRDVECPQVKTNGRI